MILIDNNYTLSVHKKSDDPYLCLHEASIEVLKEVPLNTNNEDFQSTKAMREFIDEKNESRYHSVPPPTKRVMKNYLPVHSFREEILNDIHNNQVVLIAGETGITLQ